MKLLVLCICCIFIIATFSPKEKLSEKINDEAIEEIEENTTREPEEIITKSELQDLWKYSNDFDKEMEEVITKHHVYKTLNNFLFKPLN